MDALSSALSSLAPDLKAATSIAGLGSTAYNMYNQYQNQKYQNQLRSYAQDPAKMNAYAAQFTQPLSAGLQASVANQAQGDLASRGLSDSPQIAQQVYAQTLAPFVQQNQRIGYQDALQALDLGGGAINPNNNSANSISALAKMLSTLPSNLKRDPSSIIQLMQANQVQPEALDQTQFTPDYQPDYTSGIPALAMDQSQFTPDYQPS